RPRSASAPALRPRGPGRPRPPRRAADRPRTARGRSPPGPSSLLLPPVLGRELLMHVQLRPLLLGIGGGRGADHVGGPPLVVVTVVEVDRVQRAGAGAGLAITAGAIARGPDLARHEAGEGDGADEGESGHAQ